MSILKECERILGDDVEDDSHSAEIRRKAAAKMEVLAIAAKRVCEEAKSGADGDPARSLLLFCQVDCLIAGVENVHKLLRQAVPEADDAVKQMAGVRRGPYKNVNTDVAGQITYGEPVSWAVIPALKIVVQTLKDLEDLAAA